MKGRKKKYNDKTRGYAIIALYREEHRAIPALKGTNTAGNAGQQMAKDIRDLREHTSAPNSSLQQLIDYAKNLFPDFFKKQTYK